MPYIYTDGYVLNTAALKEFDKQAHERETGYLAEVEKAATAAGVACQTLITKPATAAQVYALGAPEPPGIGKKFVEDEKSRP